MSGLSISLLGKFSVSRENQILGGIHARDFYEKGENTPELYLMVEDAAGNELFSSRENVRPQAGQSEYFCHPIGKGNDDCSRQEKRQAAKGGRGENSQRLQRKNNKKSENGRHAAEKE